MDGKSAKKGLKTGKNRTKNVKKPLKKSKFALAHLTKSTPSAEKTPPWHGYGSCRGRPDASARAYGFQKTAQKYPPKPPQKSYPQSPPAHKWERAA